MSLRSAMLGRWSSIGMYIMDRQNPTTGYLLIKELLTEELCSSTYTAYALAEASVATRMSCTHAFIRTTTGPNHWKAEEHKIAEQKQGEGAISSDT